MFRSPGGLTSTLGVLTGIMVAVLRLGARLPLHAQK